MEIGNTNLGVIDTNSNELEELIGNNNSIPKIISKCENEIYSSSGIPSEYLNKKISSVNNTMEKRFEPKLSDVIDSLRKNQQNNK